MQLAAAGGAPSRARPLVDVRPRRRRSSELLYVSDWGTDDVFIYNYKSGGADRTASRASPSPTASASIKTATSGSRISTRRRSSSIAHGRAAPLRTLQRSRALRGMLDRIRRPETSPVANFDLAGRTPDLQKGRGPRQRFTRVRAATTICGRPATGRKATSTSREATIRSRRSASSRTAARSFAGPSSC